MAQPLGFLEFDADLSAPGIIAAYDELPLWSAMFGLLLLEPSTNCVGGESLALEETRLIGRVRLLVPVIVPVTGLIEYWSSRE